MATYAEKLNSPKWQRKRLEIMQRDGFKCRICKDDKSTLNVHHLYYIKDKELYDYDNETLVTLCKDCHSYAHNELSKISSIIAFSVIKNKQTYFDVCKLLNVKI